MLRCLRQLHTREFEESSRKRQSIPNLRKSAEKR